MGRKVLICLLFVGIVIPSFYSQVNEVGVGVSKITKPKFDTNYYKKYSERFIISLFQSWRHYDIAFNQTITTKDSTSINYLADANNVTGFDVTFDKFSFSLGIRSTPPVDSYRKGKTSYINYGFSFGGNKWLLETSLRRFKGFYARNSATFVPDFNDTVPYYHDHNLLNESIKAKFFYFTNNKKFAYKSSYSCNYRQLKSSASFVLSGNVYYNKLHSDSSFYPIWIRKEYGTYQNQHALYVLGASAGGGFSFNIVLWKSFFFNLTGVLNIESQWRTYGILGQPSQKANYISASGDGRIAIGYNVRNFFISINGMSDAVTLSSGQIGLTMSFISGSFNVGYRFKARPPKWYKRVQETKIYNLF